MAPCDKVELADQKYRDREFGEALQLYTEALEDTIVLPHRVALYSNRAACYLKLHRYKEAVDECGAILAIDCNHTRVLMLRAQTLIAMKDYHSALFDITRLIEIDPAAPAAAGYRALEARLRTQLPLAPIPESDDEYITDSPPESPSSKALRSCSPTTVLPEQPAQAVQPEKKDVEAVPKPKAHSVVDYSKWNSVGDDLSDDEEEKDSKPQYRYRLQNVGLRAVNF